MPDTSALIRYITERQCKTGAGIGYYFMRGHLPSARDTYFALASLRIMGVDSPDREVVHFLSSYESFDLNSAYYAKKCLELIGAEVQLQGKTLCWSDDGEKQSKQCMMPSTPLASYFGHDISSYNKFNCNIFDGTDLFSSPLGDALKEIELGVPNLDQILIDRVCRILKSDSKIDLITMFLALEIRVVMESRGYPALSPYSAHSNIGDLLKGCTPMSGYNSIPTAHQTNPDNSCTANVETKIGWPRSSAYEATLDSTYAGHMIAQHLGLHDPIGIETFIDKLQNSDGGFRRSTAGGLSTLECCYMALRVLAEGGFL